MSIDITVNESNVSVFDGGQSNYISAYDTTNQMNSGGNGTPLKYNTTVINNGISIVSNSRITFSNPGIYNIAFSAQLYKSDSGSDIVTIWLRKNGTNVGNTTTEVWLVGNDGRSVAAWNYLVSADANDYFEIVWFSADLAVFMDAVANLMSPSRPDIPSVILTVYQI
jgi:hypothetical protein